MICTMAKGSLFMNRKPYLLAFAVLLSIAASPAHAESEAEWVALGTRIHGGFGPLIPIGIRIGLDAREKLTAEPRGLTVIFYSGEKSPCPCIADGIMIATQASPGQGTLQVASEKAAPGMLAVAVIRNRKTGEGLKYTIGEQWMPKVVEWIRTLDPSGRYQAVMKAADLFQVSALPPISPAR
jgi:formylmethanofuran dehydrogenase subunit E